MKLTSSYFSVILLLIFFCTTIHSFSQEITAIANCCNSSEAKCTGSSSCRACTNCSRCGHCNSGGSCGVCSSSSNGTRYSTSSKSSSNTSSKAVNSAVNDFYLQNDTQSKDFLKLLNVTTESLNLRNGPGANFSIKAKLKNNQELFYLAKAGDWVKVRVKDFQLEGFVHSKYISVTDN